MPSPSRRWPIAALLVAAALAAGGCSRPAPSETTGETPSPASAEAPAPSPGTTPAATPPPRPGRPPVVFDPPELDFGILDPGGKGHGAVTIRNTGAAPLTVVQSITSCGCTEADDLTGRVIPPGGSTEFNTTMKMKSGLGLKKEKVTIWFSGYEKMPVVFYYNAEVSLPVRAVPPHLTAHAASGAAPMSGVVTLESRDGRPFTVLAADGRPPVFVDFDPAGTPRNRYRLRWDITEQDRAGTVPGWWVVETDHADAPIIDLRIRHKSTIPPRPGAHWVPKDQRLVLGPVTPGTPMELQAKVEYRPKYAPDPATAAVMVDPKEPFTADLVRTEVDGPYLVFHLRITPTQTTPGLLYGRMYFGASGESSPLHVIGTVR